VTEAEAETERSEVGRYGGRLGGGCKGVNMKGCRGEKGGIQYKVQILAHMYVFSRRV